MCPVPAKIDTKVSRKGTQQEAVEKWDNAFREQEEEKQDGNEPGGGVSL